MTARRFLTIVSIVSLTALSNPVSAQQKIVLEQIYAREACSVLKYKDSLEIVSLVEKGEALMLLRPAPCFISDTSKIESYKVRTSDGTVGYIYSKYLTFNKKEALLRYKPGIYDSLHKKARNIFNGGDPLGVDYFPRVKPSFRENRMPRACYGLYITCSPQLLNNIEGYIALAKKTKINCFVIDIKEDGAPGFKADAMKKYSPSAYKRAGNNAALYKRVVKRLHEEGIWAVARIVTFKDYHFTKDHPECALWNKTTGAMLLHNKSNWPSAYCRTVWEYNVALACEVVDKFGFNEVNFDYVRFPDRMSRIERNIEMRNKYGESKLQAIQRFVTYATDEIHRHGAYVSIDVFGECANPGYTTAYGQYWPAISNVADVMCGMPYPDHFADGYYGISEPWNHPYEILKAWGARVMDRQSETPSPAVVRTWVQAYHVMPHVDKNGIDYDGPNIAKEIKGLYDAGLTGGYTTWLASCNLQRYISQSPAFITDYYEQWAEGL